MEEDPSNVRDIAANGPTEEMTSQGNLPMSVPNAMPNHMLLANMPVPNPMPNHANPLPPGQFPTEGSFYHPHPAQFNGHMPGVMPSPMYHHYMGSHNVQVPWSNGTPPHLPPTPRADLASATFQGEGAAYAPAPEVQEPAREELDELNLAPLSPPPQRERFSYTRYQLSLLNGIYEKVNYPNNTQKHLISRRLGITRDQVKIWFQNRRRKDVVESNMSCTAHKATNRREKEIKDHPGVPPHILDRVIQELLNVVRKSDEKPQKLAARRRDRHPYNSSRALNESSSPSSADENESRPASVEGIPPDPASLQDALFKGIEPTDRDSGNASSPSESSLSNSPPVHAEPEVVIPTNEQLDMVAPPNVVVPTADDDGHKDSPPSSPSPGPLEPRPPPPSPQHDVIAQGPPNMVVPVEGQQQLPLHATGFWDRVEDGQGFQRYPLLSRSLPEHFSHQSDQEHAGLQNEQPQPEVFPFPAIAQAARYIPNQPPGRVFMLDAYQQPSLISNYPNPYYHPNAMQAFYADNQFLHEQQMRMRNLQDDEAQNNNDDAEANKYIAPKDSVV